MDRPSLNSMRDCSSCMLESFVLCTFISCTALVINPTSYSEHGFKSNRTVLCSKRASKRLMIVFLLFFRVGGGWTCSAQIRRLSALDSTWVTNGSNGLQGHAHPAWLHVYLATCKLLHLALTLPATRLPQVTDELTELRLKQSPEQTRGLIPNMGVPYAILDAMIVADWSGNTGPVMASQQLAWNLPHRKRSSRKPGFVFNCFEKTITQKSFFL